MDKKTLIILVQNNSHLWDVNDADYNNPTKCMETWEEISKELKLDGGPEQAKKEWETLRDVYLRNKSEGSRRKRRNEDDPMSPQYPQKVVTLTENGKPHTTHTTAQTSMFKNGVNKEHENNPNKNFSHQDAVSKPNGFTSFSSHSTKNGHENILDATKYSSSVSQSTSTSYIHTSERFRNYRDSNNTIKSKKSVKTKSIDMIFSRVHAKDMEVEEKSLIMYVEKNPHLWDVKRLDYDDEKKCKDTWTEISLRLGLNGPDHAKESWERIRNAYMRLKTLQYNPCACCSNGRTSPTSSSYVQSYGRTSPPSTTYTKTYTEKYEVYRMKQRDIYSSTSETVEGKDCNTFLVRQEETDNIYVNIEDTEERYSPPHLIPQTTYYPRTLASEKYLNSRRSAVKRIYRETDEKETVFGEPATNIASLQRNSPPRDLFKNHPATMCDS